MPIRFAAKDVSGTRFPIWCHRPTAERENVHAALVVLAARKRIVLHLAHGLEEEAQPSVQPQVASRQHKAASKTRGSWVASLVRADRSCISE